MSLWSSLLSTYEKCSAAAGIVPNDADGVPNEKKAFRPLFHMTLKTKICVTLDGEGNLIKIVEDPKEVTIIVPCTEKSMSRTTIVAPHPLCDQLEYVDRDMTPVKYKSYIEQLAEWKNKNEKLNAVYQYLTNNSVAAALGRDIDKEKDRKLGVRFSVEIKDDMTPNVWEDTEIREMWISLNRNNGAKAGVDCFGEDLYEIANNHPKNINPATGNAKLISCNVEYGFRYTGRFTQQNEAVQIDRISSEKVHNTLIWLINNNGYGIETQTVVIWAVDSDTEAKIIPFGNTYDIFGDLKSAETEGGAVFTDIDNDFAERFANLLKGYGDAEKIKRHSKTVVIAIFDAATTGRMGVTFYREFPEDEYLENIVRWHADSAWHLTRFEKYTETGKTCKGKIEEKIKPISFVGCPSFNDIIECVYNPADKTSESYKTLQKGVRKQLIECMFGNFGFPYGYVKMACAKVSKPQSYGSEDSWQKNLNVACSLVKKYYFQKGDDIKMGLDTKRNDRDYLYGRLLAIADRLEEYALYMQGNEKARSTNAVKLMSNFAVKPYSTWGILWQQLVPYINQLKGASWYRMKIDEVMELFVDGEYEDNSPLSPLYLLGYSSQRREMSKNSKKSEEAPEEEI